MQSMLNRFKEKCREVIPSSHQVPIKYYYSLLRGFLEPEMAMLPYLARKGDLILDIGGNRGLYAYRFWEMGCDVKVFEPNTKCLSVLRAWARGKSRIGVYPTALSNREGVAELFVPVDATGVEHDSSAMLEPSKIDNYRKQPIDIKTVDSFGFSLIRMLKIDVEGHERNVLEGAVSTIKAARPAILVEIEQRHGQNVNLIFKMIEDLGYYGFFLRHGRLDGIDDFDLQRDQKLENLGRRTFSYINNFLFLDRHKVECGDYRQLFDKFKRNSATTRSAA
jgi:FkbM family methyltransferase